MSDLVKELRAMQVVRVPAWGLDYGDASYWGRKHCAHIGPWLVLWGHMTLEELAARSLMEKDE